jgi:hypothetical protein
VQFIELLFYSDGRANFVKFNDVCAMREGAGCAQQVRSGALLQRGHLSPLHRPERWRPEVVDFGHEDVGES